MSGPSESQPLELLCGNLLTPRRILLCFVLGSPPEHCQNLKISGTQVLQNLIVWHWAQVLQKLKFNNISGTKVLQNLIVRHRAEPRGSSSHAP